jgi:hypothetical protein
MPAYAKVTLVTSVFHPSDIAFLRGWSAAAPGLGGWGVRLDDEERAEEVLVLPPGADEPVFRIVRPGRDVLLQKLRRDAEPEEIGCFEGLREAVLALCPLDDDALEAIHETLEQRYPRRDRGGAPRDRR